MRHQFSITELEKRKKGPAIYLPFEGKGQKACESIDVKALNADDGVYILTNKMKERYARNNEQKILIAYQKFEM